MELVLNEFRNCLGNYFMFSFKGFDEQAEHFKDRMYQTKLCLSLAGYPVDFDSEYAIQQLRTAWLLGLIED